MGRMARFPTWTRRAPHMPSHAPLRLPSLPGRRVPPLRLALLLAAVGVTPWLSPGAALAQADEGTEGSSTNAASEGAAPEGADSEGADSESVDSDGAVAGPGADEAGGGTEGDGDSVPIARPRWIAPRRGTADEGESTSAAPAAPSADWRSGTYILVHGEPAAERLSEVVEAMLRRLGAETIERRAVPRSATTDQVRYFHVEDAAKAAALAETLVPMFGEFRVRDLTSYKPTPPNGWLEVWLR